MRARDPIITERLANKVSDMLKKLHVVSEAAERAMIEEAFDASSDGNAIGFAGKRDMIQDLRDYADPRWYQRRSVEAQLSCEVSVWDSIEAVIFYVLLNIQIFTRDPHFRVRPLHSSHHWLQLSSRRSRHDCSGRSMSHSNALAC
jgi:hypothetical protein